MLICPQCRQTNPIVELVGPGQSRSKKKRVQRCRSCGFNIVHATTGIKPRPQRSSQPSLAKRDKQVNSARRTNHGILALQTDESLGSVISIDAEPIYPAMR